MTHSTFRNPYRHVPSESKEHPTVSTIQETYTEHVDLLRQLGPALAAAVSVRYEAPPGAPVAKESVSESKGIRNPTLDVVMDPRRMAVSSAVTSAESALRVATANLRPHIAALQNTVARWEGQEGTTE